jgi:hypothetical protein
MKKLSLISAAAVIFVFVAWLVAPALALAAPDIEVIPIVHDFGDVEVGTSVTTIITISNINGQSLTVYDISFQTGSSGDFSITTAPQALIDMDPETSVDIAPGGSVDVVITFSPSSVGYSSAVLEIPSDDWTQPSVMVELGGVGVEGPQPPTSVQPILDFFDASVAAGTLYGDGPGNSANGRREALRNIIEAAGDLIADGALTEACQQLLNAYQRCDGLSRPPEFVAGPAAATLAQMILDLMGELGCQ